MALLEGNNLTEWIKALEPINPLAFKHLPAGTQIIHISSQTMQPVYFATLEHAADGLPDELEKYMDEALVHHYDEMTNMLEPLTTDGWFVFPVPAVEVPTFPAAQLPEKVKELGDGKWTTHGLNNKDRIF